MCKRIINVSRYDKRIALQKHITSSKKLKLIYNGVHDVDPSLLAHPEQNPCNLVMTARFVPQKDHALLLSVLQDIKKLPWRLDLIGTGPLQDETKAVVKESGLHKRVVFHGQTHRVAEILAKAHLYVLTSNWEGLPRSIIEALRAGLPVIASDVGGVAELVEHGKNGYLVPQADKSRLAEYLCVLLNDSRLRARMGKESRKRYMKYFTFSRMYKDTIAVYKELTSC